MPSEDVEKMTPVYDVIDNVVRACRHFQNKCIQKDSQVPQLDAAIIV
jgi:hypothetical protein